MALETQRFWLTFNGESSRKPLIYEMSKNFDVVFNIRNASVTPTIGIIALELEGDREVIKKPSFGSRTTASRSSPSRSTPSRASA